MNNISGLNLPVQQPLDMDAESSSENDMGEDDQRLRNRQGHPTHACHQSQLDQR